jgi:hypothetical protein
MQPKGVNRGGHHASEKGRPLVLGPESLTWLARHKKPPQYPLALHTIHFRMCGAPVYEISRLVLDYHEDIILEADSLTKVFWKIP